MPPQPVSRRSALAVGLGGAAALGLAACSSSTTAGRTNTAAAADTAAGDTSAGSSSAAPSSAASSGQAASTHSTSASTSSGGAPTIAALSGVKVGESIITKVDGKPTAVARPDAKTVVAHSAICTHQGCTVQASGKKLVCPCHGSQFDAFTGAVINGPAAQALASVAVKVSGTDIVAG